jgi:hypothetical protein
MRTISVLYILGLEISWARPLAQRTTPGVSPGPRDTW